MSARPRSPGKYSTQKEQPLKNFAAMPPPMAGPGRNAGDSRGDYEAGRRRPSSTPRAGCCFQRTRARAFGFPGPGARTRACSWGRYRSGAGARAHLLAFGLIYIGRAHIYRAGSCMYIYHAHMHEPAPWSLRATRRGRGGKPLACFPLLLADIAGRLSLCRAPQGTSIRSLHMFLSC